MLGVGQTAGVDNLPSQAMSSPLVNYKLQSLLAVVDTPK